MYKYSYVFPTVFGRPVVVAQNYDKMLIAFLDAAQMAVYVYYVTINILDPSKKCEL